MKVWLHRATKGLLFSVLFILFSTTAWAQLGQEEDVASQTATVSTQVDLLKNRLAESTSLLEKSKRVQESEMTNLTVARVNKSILDEANIEVSITKSNLDNINIELTESKQAVDRLEKDTQEITNQLDLVGIFGAKLLHRTHGEVTQLQTTLSTQEKLLALERQRVDYLVTLQGVADKTLQLYKAKAAKIEGLLKSQTMIQLNAEHAKSELFLQQQQAMWIQALNKINQDLAISPDKISKNEVFYTDENVYFSYLKLLIGRYQDEIQQLKVLLTKGSSIAVLKNIKDEIQVLNKQLSRVNDLLKSRRNIIDQRQASLSHDEAPFSAKLQTLANQYQEASVTVQKLTGQLTELQTSIDSALKLELSSRQKLPDLASKAWLEMGAELLLMPRLAVHMISNLMTSVGQSLSEYDTFSLIILVGMEIIWYASFYFSYGILNRRLTQLHDHEFGHINLKWIGFKMLRRLWLDIALIGNTFWLIYLSDLPEKSFQFFINLALIWIFFRAVIAFLTSYLVESVHDHQGADMKLYRRLKWTLISGGMVTMLASFVNELPVSYEFKDFFIRLFLLFLFVASAFLIRYWRVLPTIIIQHIDEQRTYFRGVVQLFGFLIPLVLLTNAFIGLIGYVNLVYTVSWYEGIFLLVMVGYLIIRGLLIEMMIFLSRLLISQLSNGWLWTEAFLKPIDHVLRIALFLMAWVTLFLIYGWDGRSAVVDRLNRLIHYRMGEVLNTVVTPLSIVEIFVIISLLYWAAKWTREFAYRLLTKKTQDLGVRNSIAILSQYSMVLLGILIGLDVLGVDFKALAVVVGAFAVTAGLGLRDLISNFASGFLLLIERPLRVGDTITIDGHEGDVIHIGSRAVTVRTWDHMDIVVPNSEICNKTFINWTSKDSIVRSVIKIEFDQQNAPETIQKIVHDVLAQNKNVLKDPTPEVFLSDLLNGHINIEVRYFVNLRLIKSRPGIRSEVISAIWKAFEEQGVRVAYPTQDLNVISLPPS